MHPSIPLSISLSHAPKCTLLFCFQTTCGNDLGWGRKRRDVKIVDSSPTSMEVISPENLRRRDLQKRQAENFDIDVGARVNIVEKYSEIREYEYLES